ncbi:MAG TPA: MarR family transcriptional regulator [Chthoniobacterales bacterium]|nr:MarR family transcriptional regulator [Chthoniobacterales bacterium]
MTEPTPEELAIPEEAIDRLAEIVLTLHRGLLLHLCESLAGGQVSFAQFFMLSHVYTQGPMSMTEIAEKMRHTTAAATGLVDRLQKLGFVDRVQSPADRRKVLVHLRPKGEELVLFIRKDVSSNLLKILLHLTPEEQKMWIAIYNKIFAYVESLKAHPLTKCT